MTTIQTINQSPRVGVSQRLLRRLGSRAIAVLERHRDKQGALESYEEFVAAVTAFNEAYDRGRNTGPSRYKETAGAEAAAKVLRQTVQAWAAPLLRDLPGLDLGVFLAPNAVPDDLIETAGRLLTSLAARQQSDTAPPAYFERLVAEVQAARDAAITARNDAQDLLAQIQEHKAEVRRLAAEVQSGLVRLRQTLRAVLGTSHRDYQKLRHARGRGVDEHEDDIELETDASDIELDEPDMPLTDEPAANEPAAPIPATTEVATTHDDDDLEEDALTA